jgi:hypothetical protein
MEPLGVSRRCPFAVGAPRPLGVLGHSHTSNQRCRLVQVQVLFGSAKVDIARWVIPTPSVAPRRPAENAQDRACARNGLDSRGTCLTLVEIQTQLFRRDP